MTLPATIAFIDIETTGLDPERHEIIEIAVVIADARTLALQHAVSYRAAPERIEDAEPEALAMNGYTPEAWADALPLRSALSLALPMLEGATIAGHNVPFDLAFIEKGCHRAFLPMPQSKYRLDTASLAWPLLHAGHIEKPSLDALARFFGLKRPHPHRALADARCALDVARELLQFYGVAPPH